MKKNNEKFINFEVIKDSNIVLFYTCLNCGVLTNEVRYKDNEKRLFCLK